MKSQTTFNSRFRNNKQRGASLLDFLLWMGLAAMAIAGITSMASSGTSQFQVNATLTEVTEIRAAVDSWAGANSDVTGVSLTEICQEGYGYSKATWCSSNQFGGTYTVTANTNTSFVDILIGDVDSEVTMALGNKLAPVSADRCSRADGSCATVQVSGTDVTVTM